MKQHITNEQLEELSGKAYDRAVVDYWPEARIERTNQDLEPEDFNIGQMIEFLDEHDYNWCWEAFEDVGVPDDSHIVRVEKERLCDSLWEAVKEVLEKKPPDVADKSAS